MGPLGRLSGDRPCVRHALALLRRPPRRTCRRGTRELRVAEAAWARLMCGLRRTKDTSASRRCGSPSQD